MVATVLSDGLVFALDLDRQAEAHLRTSSGLEDVRQDVDEIL